MKRRVIKGIVMSWNTQHGGISAACWLMPMLLEGTFALCDGAETLKWNARKTRLNY
jgi:hypothetical protein